MRSPESSRPGRNGSSSASGSGASAAAAAAAADRGRGRGGRCPARRSARRRRNVTTKSPDGGSSPIGVARLVGLDRPAGSRARPRSRRRAPRPRAPSAAPARSRRTPRARRTSTGSIASAAATACSISRRLDVRNPADSSGPCSTGDRRRHRGHLRGRRRRDRHRQPGSARTQPRPPPPARPRVGLDARPRRSASSLDDDERHRLAGVAPAAAPWSRSSSRPSKYSRAIACRHSRSPKSHASITSSSVRLPSISAQDRGCCRRAPRRAAPRARRCRPRSDASSGGSCSSRRDHSSRRRMPSISRPCELVVITSRRRTVRNTTSNSPSLQVSRRYTASSPCSVPASASITLPSRK